MKRIVGLIIWVLLFLTSVSYIRAETIQNFSVNADIRTDGTVAVSETILYDFTPLEKHGIYRTIPFVKTNEDGKQFAFTIDAISVADGLGRPYRFSENSDDKVVTLKIGDPDTLITGMHSYVITYEMKGVLTYYSDHDEFYWNATGNDWTVPIEKATFTVTLPEKTSDIRAECFTGISGSTEINCLSGVKENIAEISSTGSLSTGQGLTAVVGFPKGLVARLEPQAIDSGTKQSQSFLSVVVFLLGSGLWYVILPVAMIIAWFLYGRDPKPPMGEAHVTFSAPKTKSLRSLTPGETGVIIDEIADLSDITATIVDLARRRFIRIVEKKKNDFSLVFEKTRPENETLEPFEKKLLDGLFHGTDEVRIKDGDFITTVGETKNTLYAAVVSEGFFLRNPEKTRTVFMIIAGIALFTMNIPLAITTFLFGRAMPKKTIAGAEAAAITRGLKTFLRSQDEQLTFQAKNQMFFEKLLPYAIAFGVEEIWAKRFADLNLQKPLWYDGYGSYQFSSVYLVSGLHNSMKSFTTAATPTRSSSGFSSGFSGGSSGGGGGGGGGGSW